MLEPVGDVSVKRTGYDLATLRQDLRADIDTYLEYAGEYDASSPGLSKRISALATPSVTACALYRVSRWLYAKGLGRFSLAVALLNFFLTRVSICPASEIGGGLYIPHPATSIVFQGHAGRNLRLFAGSGICAAPTPPLHRYALRGTPTLGDDVALGSKALIEGPVTVGSGCRIGINAVVRRDIPAGAIVLAARPRPARPRPAPDEIAEAVASAANSVG